MPSALRALLTVAVPAMLSVGSFLISQYGQADSMKRVDDSGSGIETIHPVSAEDEDRMQRVAIKEETTLDMLDGRLTVEEAAAQFLEISSSDPTALDNMRLAQGDTDEEKALSQLLSFARVQAGRQPQRYGAALARAEQTAKSLDKPKHIH